MWTGRKDEGRRETRRGRKRSKGGMERGPGRSPGAQRQREGKTTFGELFIIISLTPPQTTSLERGNPHFTLGKLRLSGLSHMSDVL